MSQNDITETTETTETTGVFVDADDPTTSADPNGWRHIADRDELVKSICRLYDERGSSRYDEVVTQTEHSLQTADLAVAAGAPDALVAASLLHDIGHLLLGEWEQRADFLARDLHHEDVAARFLANWFDSEVTEPIRMHVAAKRYLCAVEPGYADALSPASVRSLAVQGGPMDEHELAAFARQDHVAGAIALRRWDDDGKDANRPVGEIRDHADRMAGLVVRLAGVAPADGAPA